MTARMVLLIENVVASMAGHERALSIVVDRDEGGAITLSTLDRQMVIALSRDDVQAFTAFACDHAPNTRPPSTRSQTARAQVRRDYKNAPERQATRQDKIQKSLDYIRTIATNGILPSVARYDRNRPDGIYSAASLIYHLSCRWSDLAERLGLRLSETQMTGMQSNNQNRNVTNETTVPSAQPVEMLPP